MTGYNLIPEKEKNDLPYPKARPYGDYDNEAIKDLALNSVIEISTYIDREKIISNSFSKLAKILAGTLMPRRHLEGQRPIDTLETMIILRDTLHRHEDHEKKQGKDTPYKIKHDISMMSDLATNLTPVIYQISKDLASFTTLSEEQQITLKKFTGALYNELRRYPYNFRRDMVA